MPSPAARLGVVFERNVVWNPENELVSQRNEGSVTPKSQAEMSFQFTRCSGETEGDVGWREWRATEDGDTVSRDGRGKLFRQKHYYPGSWGSTIS